jgi:hypothetical protein
VVRLSGICNIAEKLYDLLIHLAILDQERFEANPFYLNNEGRYPEGIHVDSYLEDIQKMTVEELSREYYSLLKCNPYFVNQINMIRIELNKRNIILDK